MIVRELVEWLQKFEDQDATVEVLQGGETIPVEFDPEQHVEYTDLRNNPFAKGKPWSNRHTILLGAKGID